MAFVSVTRLRLRSSRYLPAIGYRTWRSARQLRRAPGFVDGSLAARGLRTFWTITLWADEASMRAYRNVGAHMAAMPKLLEWCDEAAVVHWEQGSADLPEPGEVQQRMVAHGRFSKVRHPSEAHAAGRIPPEPPPRQGARLWPVHKPAGGAARPSRGS